MLAIVDTTVVIHLFRQYQPALQWYHDVTEPLGITPISWMEVMYGASSKAKQVATQSILEEFHIAYLQSVDQSWAMGRLQEFRLSHGISITDCLIASVAYRMRLPLFTHNLKDLTPLIGDLARKPYA